MRIFKKIMLLMLVAVGTSSVVYGMEDSRFLNEITFTSWLDKQKDTSTMHKILGLFHNVMSRQLVHNAVTIIRILKLYNNAMSGQLDAMQEMEDMAKFGGVKVDGVSWFIPDDKVITIKTDGLRGNFGALKEIIKHMQSNGIFKEDGSMRLLNERIKIIFLEDCMDCEDNLEAFATAALLALKNPGQVLMRIKRMQEFDEEMKNPEPMVEAGFLWGDIKTS